MSKNNNTVKVPKKISIPFSITWPKKGEKIKPIVNTTNVLISGILITCIALSLVSGFIDLVFFSGLSKSWYTVATIKVAAGILFSIMSLGFTSAKFWCAMQLGAINELQTRLKNDKYTWYKNLNKLKLKWHIAHKFLITVSLITSISLSVVSIGDAIRKNQNVIKRANDDIQKITKYYNTTDTSDDVQFKALVDGTAASSTAGSKATEQAAKIWPIIEAYRNDRAEFESQFGNNFGSKEIEYKGKIADEYWDEQNSLVQNKIKAAGRTMSISQIRNITSEAVLATRIKSEIEESVKNNSLDELTELADKTKNKAVQEIKNLEGRYYMPGSDEPVVFDPNNISGSINLLGDIKAAYENDTGDVGESAKMFMLIGPTLESMKKTKAADISEAYSQKVSVSSFGTTEIMMMVLIMIFGIVQEFLIALFTPKSTIDRKMLSRFDAYFGEDFNIDLFLLKTYKDYLKKGIINQKDFEAKARKCVELMEDDIDDVIERYSKKSKTEKASFEQLKKQYTDSINDTKNKIDVLELSNKSKDKIIENLNKKLEEVEKSNLQKIQGDIIYASKETTPAITEVRHQALPHDTPAVNLDNTPKDMSMDPGTLEIAHTLQNGYKEVPTAKVVEPVPVRATKDETESKLEKLNEVLNSFEDDLRS